MKKQEYDKKFHKEYDNKPENKERKKLKLELRKKSLEELEKIRKQQREANKRYWAKNKEKEKWKRIEKKYGITKEQWFDIYKEQDGKCYLCQRTEKQIKKSRSKYLVVDHNHKTGEIRGLLCNFCNGKILTIIKECPNYAIRLHTYLTRKVNYGVVPEQQKEKIDCHTHKSIKKIEDEGK